MSRQTAQSRSCSGKPGGSHAPSRGNGAFLGLSKAPSPGSKALGELVPPPPSEKSVKTSGPKGAWRCTMAPHGAAAEPGQMIWEMSVERGVQVWIVNGRLVRSVFDIDFTAGGHDYVYEFVP